MSFLFGCFQQIKGVLLLSGCDTGDAYCMHHVLLRVVEYMQCPADARLQMSKLQCSSRLRAAATGR